MTYEEKAQIWDQVARIRWNNGDEAGCDEAVKTAALLRYQARGLSYQKRAQSYRVALTA